MAKKGAEAGKIQARIGFLEPGAPLPEESGLGTTVWRVIYCSGYDIDEKGERQYHHFMNRRCSCEPGPHWQTYTLAHQADEVALVGGRGSGKSETGMALLMGGDLEFGLNGEPYIFNKFYKALVLRRNSKDLHDWFTRARDYFGAFGFRAIESPTMKLVGPSGCEIICDHLADEGAYQKYQGHEYAIILIEECPQIQTQTLYENLRRSNRVKDGLKMKPRMIVLGNPDGPGLGWFIKRFIKLRHAPVKGDTQFPTGRPVKPGELWRNPVSGETRMYFHSTVYDNPYFLRGNARYVKQLEGIDDDNERRRWLLGDFTAMVGQYFPTYRPEGPLAGEEANARHVYPADQIKIEPWWPRIMGMDIGYRHHAAVYKAAVDPHGRLVVYDEMVEAEVDNEEWGMNVARWCQKELPHLPSRSIPLFLSHDAFGNRGEGRTQAEQIEAGIRRVLGSTGSLLLDLPVADDAERDFFRAAADRQQCRILVSRPFSRKRVDGWSFIRILMKWKDSGAKDARTINPDHVRRLMESGDQEALTEYLRGLEDRSGEVLPKLVISDKCRVLKDALSTLVYDTDGKNPEDVKKTETIEDDAADAFRYLCVGYRKIAERLPRSVFMQQRISEAKEKGASSDDLWNMQPWFDEQYEEQANDRAFSFGLGSSRSRQVRYQN